MDQSHFPIKLNGVAFEESRCGVYSHLAPMEHAPGEIGACVSVLTTEARSYH